MPETSLGGSRFRFGETLWTRVLAAKAGARAALDDLIRAYWKPVYHFVRRTGRSVEDAKDLTQGFFAAMLERDFLRNVEPARGKFKTFLLTCLERHLTSERERTGAKKRGGGRVALPIDATVADPDAATPEDAFERAWGETVIARAFERMRGSPYFRVLDLHLTHRFGAAQIASRLRCAPKSVENALVRGRKRFREAVLEEILQYVSTPREAEEELLAILHRIR